MVKVTFYPNNKSIEVKKGTSILRAARKAGVILESPCSGAGTCGKCKVKLNKESLQQVKQNHHLSLEEEAQGLVLSCHTQVMGDISAEIISNQSNKNLKILTRGKSLALELDTYIQKEYQEQERMTNVFAGRKFLVAEEGNTVDKNYGVVVDIGTTTLVTSLVDVNTGEELASISSLNPQSIQAQDVLSRIKFASEEAGLQLMYAQLIEEINRMLSLLVKKASIQTVHIYEVVFSGNTCMLHLATNTSPDSLGKYPYTPKLFGGTHLKAIDYGLNISPYGLIYLPPIISAYVGADIVSGILASRLQEQKGISLFIDIGTNGEMVLSTDGKLLAASTAAGPAFEGMNIRCGMRAGQGAIELFDIKDNAELTIRVIGGEQASGICGSGLLDIVGELAAHKVINKSGRLVDNQDIPPFLKEKLVKENGKKAFKLTEKVYLSQKDIRQVQLAKGAIRAGINFLLQSKEIEYSKVDRVLIAGSFGYHLRPKSLINIGLLPAEFAGKIEFIGNTSQSGGQAFLLNKTYRKQMEHLVKEIEVLELSNYKNFEEVFINCLSFESLPSIW